MSPTTRGDRRIIVKVLSITKRPTIYKAKIKAKPSNRIFSKMMNLTTVNSWRMTTLKALSEREEYFTPKRPYAS